MSSPDPTGRHESAKAGRSIGAVKKIRDLLPVLGTGPEVREALTNLILNAGATMPKGGTPTFTGQADTDEVGRQFVDLLASDTGEGIPADVRGKIFEPYFSTTGMQGTRLGLGERQEVEGQQRQGVSNHRPTESPWLRRLVGMLFA